MHVSKACLLAALALTTNSKADVFVVGPTEVFTDIQSAVDAADSGDLVLVQAGEYSSFKVDGKGLSILGDGPGAPMVLGSIRVRNLPPNQIFVLRGFNVDASQDDRLEDAFFAAKCDGVLWVESCRFSGDDGLATLNNLDAVGRDGAKLVNARASVWNQCTFMGGEGASSSDDDAEPFIGSAGHGLNLDRGTHSVFNSSASGNNGGSDFDEDGQSAGHAGSGIQAEGVVFASGNQLSGGKGGSADCDPFAGCGHGGDGGNGIEMLNNSKAIELDNQFAPGLGGSGGSAFGESAPDGNAGVHVKLGFESSSLALAGKARLLRVQSPLRLFETGSLDVQGEAGDLVFAQISLSARQQSNPAVVGLLFPAPPVRVVFLGSIPATGELNFPFSIQAGSIQAGSVHAGFGAQPHAQLFIQALALDENGVTTASNPTELTLLDPAF